MSFFSSSTPFDSLIDSCTSPSLSDVSWTQNMEVVETITRISISSPPSAAIDSLSLLLKCIKKRVQSSDPRVSFYSITLLDFIIKNGNALLHSLVLSKDYLEFLYKFTIGLKPISPCLPVCLNLLQSLYSTFKSHPTLGSGINDIYSKMMKKGIVFPDSNKDNSAPILTPPPNPQIQKTQSQTSSSPPSSSPSLSHSHSHSQSSRLNESKSSSPLRELKSNDNSPPAPRLPYDPTPFTSVTTQYVNRVNSELLISYNYCESLRDSLIEVLRTSPQQLLRNENEYILALSATVKDIRNRLSHLIVEIEDERLLDNLIQIIDIVRMTMEFYNVAKKNAGVPNAVLAVPQWKIPNLLTQNETQNDKENERKKDEKKRETENKMKSAEAKREDKKSQNDNNNNNNNNNNNILNFDLLSIQQTQHQQNTQQITLSPPVAQSQNQTQTLHSLSSAPSLSPPPYDEVAGQSAVPPTDSSPSAFGFLSESSSSSSSSSSSPSSLSPSPFSPSSSPSPAISASPSSPSTKVVPPQPAPVISSQSNAIPSSSSTSSSSPSPSLIDFDPFADIIARNSEAFDPFNPNVIPTFDNNITTTAHSSTPTLPNTQEKPKLKSEDSFFDDLLNMK